MPSCSHGWQLFNVPPAHQDHEGQVRPPPLRATFLGSDLDDVLSKDHVFLPNQLGVVG
jgi:hypothetical protein